MNEKNPDKKLNLNRDNIEKPTENEPMTPEQAAQAMGAFYNTMGNCMVNMVAIHDDIAKSLREISTDSSVLVELAAKTARKLDVINPVEFEEIMNPPDEPEKPANSKNPSEGS